MVKELEGRRSLRGTITVPGDKSISHRAVMLGSVARGNTTIRRISDSQDVLTTVEAFKKMGIPVRIEGCDAVVTGAGLEGFVQRGKSSSFEIDCRNSGTTARLLTGLLSGSGIRARLDGDASLRKRPMMRVVAPLTAAGAVIRTKDGYLPVELEGGKILPIRCTVPVPSAQVKSALMLAALFIQDTSVITELTETRDHTERMLIYMDGRIKIKNLPQGREICITGRRDLTPVEFSVPGDISSAVFFIAAALISPSSELIVEDVGLNPTRAYILEIFKRMGGRIEIELHDEFPEPRGTVRVRHSKLKGITVGGLQMPFIIDEIPALAACGVFAKGETVVKGVAELRIKESDRIMSIVDMVRSFGGKIDELEDGFVIQGGKPSAADVESFGDHRIAMAASVIALGTKGKTAIGGADCVGVSFPRFFEILEDCSS